MENRFWSYVSTKAGCDPVKTIFLCAPYKYASNKEAEQFAERTGWKKQVEEDAAVLIVPFTDNWHEESLELLYDIYEKERNSFCAPSGESIPGRNGIVWTWETLIYLIGYEDGADYAGNVLVKFPGMFAGTVLVDGRAHDLFPGEQRTCSWLVKHPSEDYQLRNKDIPTALWMYGKENDDGKTRLYFCRVNHTNEEILDDDTKIYRNQKHPAWSVLETTSLCGENPKIAERSMHVFFNHVIRWKNSPDGTLSYHTGKEDFYKTNRYIHGTVNSDGRKYPYSVYLPAGMTKEEAKGLPVVFSVHGRGEPAWIFAEKNGWEDLADETKGFITVLPDSEGNIWTIERDFNVIEALVKEMVNVYGADEERMYMTGFSNGAIFTCQQASSHPALFAAASPWNGPGVQACRDAGIAGYVYDPSFSVSGYEMPFWICVGDNDTKASVHREDELEIVLPVNHCNAKKKEVWDGENHYTAAAGYTDGDRFHTDIYRNEENSIRVGLTVMKNMPHGAVYDESRAAWEFMRRFRRVKGSKTVRDERGK